MRPSKFCGGESDDLLKPFYRQKSGCYLSSPVIPVVSVACMLGDFGLRNVSCSVCRGRSEDGLGGGVFVVTLESIFGVVSDSSLPCLDPPSSSSNRESSVDTVVD